MLTPAQQTTLKNDINSIPELASLPNNTDGAATIRAYYQVIATPPYHVWKTAVPFTASMQEPGFDWTRVDNLTTGKSRIIEFMLASEFLNASFINIRSGIISAFTTAQDLATRQAIFNSFSRLANRGEKLLASGVGSPTNDQGVGPSTMTFEGLFTLDEIIDARNS